MDGSRKSRYYVFSLSRLCLLAVLGVTSGPFAPNAHAGQKLSFDTVVECVDRYWRRQLESGVIDADAKAQLTKAGRLPSLALNVPLSNATIYRPPSSTTLNSELVLSQELINLTRNAEIRALEQATSAAEFDLEDQMLSVLSSLPTPYFNAIVLAERRSILKERSKRMDQVIAVLHELTRLRLADHSDYLSAQVEGKSAQLRLAQLEADLQDAYGELRIALGMPATEGLDLEEPTQSTSGDVRLLARNADLVTDHLPSVTAAKSLESSASSLGDAARNEWLPTLSLTATHELSILARPELAPGSNRDTFTLLGQLSWNAFDQGARTIRANQAGRQRVVAEAKLEAAKIKSRQNILLLQDRLRAQLKVIEIARKRADLAQEAYKAAWQLFKRGKRSFISLKSLDDALFESELELVTYRGTMATTRATIKLLLSYESGKRRKAASAPSSCPSPPRTSG